MRSNPLRRRGGLALLLAAAALPARAAWFGGGAEEDTEGEDAEAPAGRAKGSVALPPGARAERDLAYGSDPQQRLDVYLPANASKAPIVLMVHGGAWMIGDKGNRGVVPNKVARWLPRGYIFASANYRMDRSRPNPLQQADDVARALAFVQQKAASWGGDPARVLLMGHSAGAHLVALLAADPHIAERQGAKPWLGTVPLDSAAYDLLPLMERRHFRFYDRVFGSDPKVWQDNSPYHRLNGTPGPLLLVCSSKRDDSCTQAQRFAAKVSATGAKVSVLPMALNHGQINGQLGLPGAYTEQVEAFMKSLGLP
jgi:arylformamidase